MAKTAKQIEFEEKYGGLSERERNDLVRKSISDKFAAARERAEAAQAKEAAKYEVSYGELVKGVADAKKRISELEGKPEEFLKQRRAQLEAEYENAEKYDLPRMSNKELWVSEQLVKYMGKTDGAYRKAKDELLAAKKELAIFLAKKEEREEELADVIEAERYRSKRADLFSADPEALRALGIAPLPSANLSSEGSDEATPTGHYMDSTRQSDYWENAYVEKYMERMGYGK